MSAKENYLTAPVVLPVLPPEIWSSIFRFATWSTDIFNPRLMVYMGYDISYREQLREFKIPLVTKKYLVRVCKAWYNLASPFLFEYIFLGKGEDLVPLRDSMLRSEHDVELLPRNIGWWTQRLDVHMRDRRNMTMDVLADILRRLPNLRILTFNVLTGFGRFPFYDDVGYLPKKVLQATGACRDTLRFLNWYGGLRPSPDTWASFLENHPGLEAINAPVDLDQFGNSHIVLNSLKSVYIHCHADPPASRVENGHWNIEFPNICHAIYDIASPGSISHNDFLQKIGPNLTSIQVNSLGPGRRHIAFGDAFQRIVVACKNLTRVDIVSDNWLMPTFFLFPKMIHTLGIRVIPFGFSGCLVDAFFESMHIFLSGFPSLKTICFMDQGNIRALRAHPQTFSSNLDHIIMLGINVLDHEYNSLGTVPSKDPNR